MTPLNTGHGQKARVLQALRIPGRVRLDFEPGKHLCFVGTVKVGSER
jgi:hypothetical protein